MGQTTTGIRGVLSHPKLYTIFQNLMGAKKIRRKFVRDFVCPVEDCNILDIGCGPADILAELPKVNYWGMDVCEAYITQAKEKFGTKGHFICNNLTQASLAKLPDFDIVMGLGVLHHLDDEYAAELLSIVQHSLKPGGRFVSFDPCIVDGQNAIARFIIMHDRGLNVRMENQYKKIVSPFFQRIRGEVRHQSWIPYTHYMMECHKL